MAVLPPAGPILSPDAAPPDLTEAPVSVSVTEILNDLLNGYDKRVRPNYGGELYFTSLQLLFH